jgi:hypothetical protein
MQKYFVNDRNRDRDMQNREKISLITWLVPLPRARPYVVIDSEERRWYCRKLWKSAYEPGKA